MADEVWSSITATEVVLRDLVEDTLSARFGGDWIERSGLSPEGIEKLRTAYVEEEKRRDGGEVNQRLIYYSNLSDLLRIFKTHWSWFSDCFGDFKSFNLLLGRLIGFRNPEMHGRDLLPFEEHLALGITGEIRNKVTIHRSQRDDDPEVFPRIEQAMDSFGSMTASVGDPRSVWSKPDITLHPGDTVTYKLRAWDPEGKPVRWHATWPNEHRRIWAELNELTWRVTEQHISQPAEVQIYLVGSRDYHRIGSGEDGWDQVAVFLYNGVLPARGP